MTNIKQPSTLATGAHMPLTSRTTSTLETQDTKSDKHRSTLRLLGRHGHTLIDGEEIVMVLRPRFILPTRPLLMLIGVLFLTSFMLRQQGSGWGELLFWGLLIVTPIQLWRRWTLSHDYWVITNKRLLVGEGIMKRKATSVELRYITGISTHSTPSTRLRATSSIQVFIAGQGPSILIHRQRDIRDIVRYLREGKYSGFPQQL